ncbi:hypothetical protein [Ornithinicoccus hortensis]|uniref:Integral membrane protein n=1 Tax=Ornithinicoccus hortensis TaxID=82346 RepID=A0A542YQ42_9MICO|nr:hypothetical protein [Ornithinicoccus hortensis]TQL50222.1 hypothetical protein FB467_1326 [Ornithinicoccus hortensis]
MEFVYNLVVGLHFVGLVALLVGYVIAVTRKTEPVAPGPLMVWGARAQVLTGLILVGLGEAALDHDFNHTKIGVKLVVAIAVAALVEISNGRNRRGATASPILVHVAAVLVIANMLIAFTWN